MPCGCSFQLLASRYQECCFWTVPLGKWMLSKPERQKSQVVRLCPCSCLTCSFTWIFSHMEFLFFLPFPPKCFKLEQNYVSFFLLFLPSVSPSCLLSNPFHIHLHWQGDSFSFFFFGYIGYTHTHTPHLAECIYVHG